jgi:hypothetical protein
MGKLRKLLGLERRRDPVSCCEQCRRAAAAAARGEKQTEPPRNTDVEGANVELASEVPISTGIVAPVRL